MIASQVVFINGVAPNAPRLDPVGIFSSAWKNRDLVFRLARREVQARYKGSLLGLVWSFVVPLTMLAVYTFVFTVIFQPKFESPTDRKPPFFLIVFGGMICVNLFCDCIGRAPGLMLGNVSYIKKVVFPLEILPVVVLASEFFTAVTSSLVLIGVYLGTVGRPPMTALLLPVVIFPLMVLLVGLLWFISSLGVYIRDLRQLVMVLLGMIGFLSPLFYPLSVFPRKVRWVVYFNPMTVPLEQVRQVLFWGIKPNWYVWGGYLLAAWTVAWMGRVWFSHAQRGFADVV